MSNEAKTLEKPERFEAGQRRTINRASYPTCRVRFESCARS